MFNLTYIESLELLVCAVDVAPMKKETKDSIRTESQEKTGIQKVLVIERSFEVVEKSEKHLEISSS
ncbi:hypothetical protein [Carnobacterium sp. ISL-102]|uniref:hypothetical protein n=1 Tax=Carnobacterium sp. ISL-102 TaxID=2819142 RepID=UPI001BE721EA|nr:hypothetical protein [Carnobacterium sp. ISL-102]MBT2732110.1 hypothetical protein [Carnobacterium sp. ISL-102]